MSLDFQQVQEQVRQLGENAAARHKELEKRRELAKALLETYAVDFEAIQNKVQQAVEQDSTLRCARPKSDEVGGPEPLNAAFQLPDLPIQATIIAADGSQIPLDRHAAVEYCLVNVGGIALTSGSAQAPLRRVYSRLMYDEALKTLTGKITEAGLALLRDKEERTLLAEMADEVSVNPVVAFTDGPIELWGAREPGAEAVDFQKHLKDYLETLKRLEHSGAIMAGYVDKPTANLVVRMLEVLIADDQAMADLRRHQPLQGVTDFELYSEILKPGERSAVYAIQTQSARQYKEGLALHFFYLNVGRPGHNWLARIEVPAWVVVDYTLLDTLQAVIVDQCRAMGSRPYPYLLHRAHETAVVSMEEREQVAQMINLELRRQGIEPGEQSQKQASKDLKGRTGYKQ